MIELLKSYGGSSYVSFSLVHACSLSFHRYLHLLLLLLLVLTTILFACSATMQSALSGSFLIMLFDVAFVLGEHFSTICEYINAFFCMNCYGMALNQCLIEESLLLIILCIGGLAFVSLMW